MTDLELLGRAIEIAVQAHKGKTDRYGAPFILHPLRVMSRLQTPPEQTVGVLHDVLEKTTWTKEDLEKEGFPLSIIEALICVTKQDGEDYDKYIRRAAANAVARRVKLADLEDNMDVRRMKDLREEDRERLKKYLSAWRELQTLP